MPREGFPQPQNNHELPAETVQKIKGFNEAAKIWSALEKGPLAAVPEDTSIYEEIISSLEFLKEKHLRTYTPEQEQEQFERVDAFIKKLKGEEGKVIKMKKQKKDKDEEQSIAA